LIRSLTMAAPDQTRPGRQYWKLNEPSDEPACGPRRKNYVTTLTMLLHPRSWPKRWMRSVRGDVYELKAPKNARGHEQAGARYAVVVQSDDLPLSTWLIAPTSTGRRATSFRPEISIGDTMTRILVEQLTVIDPQARLGAFVDRLGRAEIEDLNRALGAVLGLD